MSEIKIVSHKRKLKELVTSRAFIQEMLKEVLRAEGKQHQTETHIWE